MSVRVEYDNWGRMGNRMFQYAFGLIVSRLREDALLSDGLPNFNIPATTSDFQINNPLSTRIFGNNTADLQQLIDHQGDIIVNSFVQKAEFFIHYRDLLRNAFKAADTISCNEGKLVVHIRETDYQQINCFLGYDFYRRLINNSGLTDVIIVTDNSNCEAVQRLLSEGCTLNSEGYVGSFNSNCDNRGMYDFRTLLTSENIAISQSSFSWWAAFLGTHKKIIFPYRTSSGMWKVDPGPDDVDLYFDFGKSQRYVE